DLDILLYGDRQMDTPRLQVPHYHMHARSFVLYPLAEWTADLIMPDGTPLQSLLQHCPDTGLERLCGTAGRACIMSGEHHCESQEDYTVEGARGPGSRNVSQHACLAITAMLPVEGRITGICHV